MAIEKSIKNYYFEASKIEMCRTIIKTIQTHHYNLAEKSVMLQNKEYI